MSGFGTAIGFLASAYLFREYSSPDTLQIDYKYKSYSVLRNQIVPSILGQDDKVKMEDATSEYFKHLKTEIFGKSNK